jgi:hypothetical protein
MHEVNQLLKQDEVSWNRTDTRANHDAVELLLFELGQNDRFGSLAKIGQADARFVTTSLQMFLVCGQSRHHSGGGHVRIGGVGGIGEIDQCGIQSNNQHTLPGCILGILRRGLSFSVHILMFVCQRFFGTVCIASAVWSTGMELTVPEVAAKVRPCSLQDP